MNIKELLKCAHDPIYFIETYCKIEHPVSGPIPFTLYPFQKEFVEAIHAGSVIAPFARQMGKTALTAAYLLWTSLFRHNQRSIVISRTRLHSGEVLRRVRFMYEQLPDSMQIGVIKMTKDDIMFETGSRITIAAANANAVRGCSVNILVFEEFAFWTKEQQKEVVMSAMPALHSHGKLIVASTLPNEKNLFNLMFEDAVAGNNSLKPLRYSWQDHPERTVEWAETMKRMLGQKLFETEFEVKI